MKTKFKILCLFCFIATFSFAQKDQDEPNITRDVVVLDDHIVNGSQCVGMDCVDGENFGFSTIRLKENNLRIAFDDTSASSTFPNNDWQITINDSSNGGLNKFAIDDITGARTPFTIEAGARTNALYVDDGGRIGIGTNTPVADVHTKTGNTPTLRLEQDGSSGFTPQTWDMAGNEANFFIRDATNGSTLPFRIRPGAPTSSIDVAASGNIGIGTESPDQKIDIESNAESVSIRLTKTGGGDPWELTSRDTSFVIGNTSDTQMLTLSSSGNIGIGTETPNHKLHVVGDIGLTGLIVGASDQRLKKDIQSIDNALDIVGALDGKQYSFKTNTYSGLNLPTGIQYGLLAQEVQQVLANIVYENHLIYANAAGQSENLKGINYQALIPILVNAINEQEATIENQQALIERLLSNQSKIEERLLQLEK